MYIVNRKAVEEIASSFIESNDLDKLYITEVPMLTGSITESMPFAYKNNKGMLQINLYTSEEGWLDVTQGNPNNLLLPTNFAFEDKPTNLVLNIVLGNQEMLSFNVPFINVDANKIMPEKDVVKVIEGPKYLFTEKSLNLIKERHNDIESIKIGNETFDINDPHVITSESSYARVNLKGGLYVHYYKIMDIVENGETLSSVLNPDDNKYFDKSGNEVTPADCKVFKGEQVNEREDDNNHQPSESFDMEASIPVDVKKKPTFMEVVKKIQKEGVKR